MTRVGFTPRTGAYDKARSTGRDFALIGEDGLVSCEVRASWYDGTAVVWVMMGSSSALREIPLAERPTHDDLINLGVAVVARVAPSYHPLWTPEAVAA